MLKLLILLVSAGGMTVCSGMAAERAAGGPFVVPLWEKGAPGFEALREQPEQVLERNEPEFPSFSITTNIHQPSLLAYLPPRSQQPMTALIIAPGGGHRFLTMGREGMDLAAWLQQRGIAAFVLKYRLARAEGSPYSLEHCVEDGKRAVEVVRARAQEWNLDPERIGMVGFSAGGRPVLGAAMSQSDPANSSPDFLALVYAEIPEFGPLTRDFPPTFIAVTFDDTPKAAPALQLATRLRELGVETELHVYSRGGHGYGVAQRPGLPVSRWPEQLFEWLKVSGWVEAPTP